MVWSCKQNASGKASQTSFTCESKRGKADGTTTNTMGKLHWRFRMEPLGASTKWNVGSCGGPWCVAAQSWSAAPATLTDMSGLERRRRSISKNFTPPYSLILLSLLSEHVLKQKLSLNMPKNALFLLKNRKQVDERYFCWILYNLDK